MTAEAPEIKAFFDEATFTVSYVVSAPATREAVIIDPVLDYEPGSARLSTGSADKILAYTAQNGLNVKRILETHVHADHLTAAQYLKAKTGARIGIGAHVDKTQQHFRIAFGASDVSGIGKEFEDLFEDGARLPLGHLTIEVLHTPGHTPACVSYLVGDAVFVGDTLFMPDYGTARTDFPGGDAAALYRSIRRILAMPPQTRIYLCHDYKAPGRDHYAWETTVSEQRAANIHIHDNIEEAAFVRQRMIKDATLAAPALLLPSVQVNMRAGHLPPPEDDGRTYLKIPVTRLPELA